MPFWDKKKAKAEGERPGSEQAGRHWEWCKAQIAAAFKAYAEEEAGKGNGYTAEDILGELEGLHKKVWAAAEAISKASWHNARAARRGQQKEGPPAK